MRKLLVTAIMGLMGTGAFAQTTQGTVVVEGSLGYSQSGMEQNDRENNGFSIAVHPSIGYFIKDQLRIGVSPSFSYHYSALNYNAGMSREKEYVIGLSPFITKYIAISDKLYFTAGGHVGIDLIRRKYKPSDADTFKNGEKGFTFHVGAAPGLTYFATEKLGIYIVMGGLYFSRLTNKYNSNQDDKSTQNNFEASISPYDSTIGISYFINR